MRSFIREVRLVAPEERSPDLQTLPRLLYPLLLGTLSDGRPTTWSKQICLDATTQRNSPELPTKCLSLPFNPG
jgi:hypothetical protein